MDADNGEWDDLLTNDNGESCTLHEYMQGHLIGLEQVALNLISPFINLRGIDGSKLPKVMQSFLRDGYHVNKPLTVFKRTLAKHKKKGKEYALVDGRHRYEAAEMLVQAGTWDAGKLLPCVIYDGDVPENVLRMHAMGTLLTPLPLHDSPQKIHIIRYVTYGVFFFLQYVHSMSMPTLPLGRSVCR